MSFAKQTISSGGTFLSDSISSVDNFTDLNINRNNLYAWGGDNLTHSNPGLFDLLGGGGREMGTIEAGGFDHFRARAKVEITH